MGVLQDIFGRIRAGANLSRWKELGTYQATFVGFGADAYKSHLVRSCIRALAEHTSKANVVSTDKSIQQMISVRPNKYMNGKDFLYKVRTMLELKNTVFIYIERDDKGNAAGLYPIPYESYEGLESQSGRLYIKFMVAGPETASLTLPWSDLAVLRKDYNKYEIGGDENKAIMPLLDVVNTSEQGISNAVKSTANLRGILKSTKAMLAPEMIKKQKDQFVADYMNIENAGGIASLDATQEFTPISMNPTVTSWEQMKEFRENVYRYYGVNDHIVMSDYTEAQLEAFYESKIEPFLVALSLELTYKVFTDRQRGFGNNIHFESNRMQYASNSTKLSMVQLVDRGALTPNEWRMMFNLSPIPGGDVPIRRLDTAAVNEHNDLAELQPEEQNNGTEQE